MDVNVIVFILSCVHTCIPRTCGEELNCNPDIPHGLINNETCAYNYAPGPICYYSCDEGYAKNIDIVAMMCSSNGEWRFLWPLSNFVTVSDLCQHKHCPSNVLNGNLSATCSTREVGSICGYICNAGYQSKPGVPTITCQTSNWSADTRTLCTKTECPSTIPNGNISSTCTREYNSYCSYHCNRGYLPAMKIPTLRCNASVQWSLDSYNNDKPCLKIECPSYIPNGYISSTCTREYNSYCSYYQCYSGYRHPWIKPTLHCNASGQWSWHTYSSDKVCISIIQTTTTTASNLCPATIPNGQISNSCDRSHYSECRFSCDTGCYRYTSTLTCSGYGSWYHGDTACRCQDYTTTTTDYNTQYESHVGVTPAIVASIVGMLVLVVIVIPFMCLFRIWRRIQRTNQRTTIVSTSNSGARTGTVSSRYQTTGLQQTTQQGMSDTPSQPTEENIYIQAPPAYDTIVVFKPEPHGPLPSYEEVTAHPSNFNVELSL